VGGGGGGVQGGGGGGGGLGERRARNSENDFTHIFREIPSHDRNTAQMQTNGDGEEKAGTQTTA